MVNAARPSSNSDKEIINLRNKFYDWLMEKGTLELNVKRDSWLKRKAAELADLKPTPATVELAVNLQALSMLWKGYQISFSIGDNLGIMMQALAEDEPTNFKVIEGFYNCMLTKKEEIYGYSSFQKAIKAILPKPYQVAMSNFPSLTDLIQIAPRQYFMILIAELAEVCQDIGPSIIAHRENFWEQLEIVSIRDNFQPLIKAYQKFCQYFKDGAPFDKAFEYYELVTSITNDLMQMEGAEAKRIRSAHVDKLVVVQASTSQTKGSNPEESEERLVNEEVERAMRHKFNLAMNYVEELHQGLRSGTVRDKFHPTTRADEEQIHEIATLFRDLMTPQHIKDLQEVDYKINLEVSKTNLPEVVKSKVNALTSILHTRIRNSKTAQSTYSSGESSGELWGQALAEAFSSQLQDHSLATSDDQQLLSNRPSLQNNPVIWRGIKNSVLKGTNDSEKTHLLQWAQNKLNGLQEYPRLITSYELDQLRNVFMNLIKPDSREHSSAEWEQKLCLMMSELSSSDLAMMMVEIVGDFGQLLSAQRLHRRLEEEVKPSVKPETYSILQRILPGKDGTTEFQPDEFQQKKLIEMLETSKGSDIVKFLNCFNLNQ
ncbi:uncharacterized protein PGTG_07427 [Puccinia graminis f. sp. tritici CRL 75-36-700-3]|uniref:Uncharacterized protein n=1 Tax=Puccinia graminis f. sp. tritici (strain CRL 75-36-700-3 / race SCCL) TaxID=418459 RepID=E3K9Z6_PUCGT|nr:uncharacterized protein PGTG_07427 [Puccinia graminis f. sp. tritici CRL 75-36-700-3]EFP81175.2 hypothetical protein PGTG_07427 [Puccinia graminis f. sp. tritici CRL 75-36-700-3]